EQSAIPEVAATIPTSDDPTLPVLTFRFWLIGTIFSIFSAAVAQFMYFRAASIQLNNFSCILLSYPVGVFLAKTLPDWSIGFHWPSDFIFARGTFIGGSLNPGPYNVKEHTLIVIAASTNNNNAYACDIIAIQRLFYGPKQNPNDVGWAAAILLIWTTQCVGYGFAGLCRSWLVYPGAMWWPSNLVIANLLHVFHAKSSEGIVADRINLFKKVTTWVIVYEFLPQYFAPYISRVSILCLILAINQQRGASLGFLSFDWQELSSFSPLYTPFWAQMNTLVPIFISFWIVGPWMYKQNVWDAQLFPLTSPSSFTTAGNHYNISKILNSETLVVEDDLYNAYSPLRLSAFWALAYGMNFAAITAILVHAALFHGKEIADGFRASRTEEEDVHFKMMRKYPEVPSSWYFATLGIFLALSIFTVEHWTEFQIRWWGVLAAMGTVIIFILPIGIVQAISTIQIGTNVITELIFGYLVPGKAIANVCFKTYGYISMAQSLSLVADLKLGVYMKIPPKAMFICQLYSTLIGAVVNYAVLDQLIRHVPDIWLTLATNPQWDATSALQFYTASLLWGAIGPARTFGPDSPYHVLLWFFLIGAFLPIPGYLLHRRYPKFGWNYINWPIMTQYWGGSIFKDLSPAYITTLVVSYMSQFHMKRYRRDWYDKYNYTISAALDSGSIVTAIILYLGVTLANLNGNEYVFWAFNPNTTQYLDQDYCLNNSAV
ncbi:oligopeptide transporter OPT family, partial [Blyttiomyces helicus]